MFPIEQYDRISESWVVIAQFPLMRYANEYLRFMREKYPEDKFM